METERQWVHNRKQKSNHWEKGKENHSLELGKCVHMFLVVRKLIAANKDCI